MTIDLDELEANIKEVQRLGSLSTGFNAYVSSCITLGGRADFLLSLIAELRHLQAAEIERLKSVGATSHDVHRVCNIATAALDEVERLRNPTPGDIDSQAASWVAVWKALEGIGLLEFIGSMRGGRVRAVEFIAHLGSEVERLKKELADVRAAFAECRVY